MHFEAEMTEAEVPKILRNFVDIAGERIWDRRLAWLEDEVRRETGMQQFWKKRRGMELGFMSVVRRYRAWGWIAVNELSTNEFRFLAFAAMVVRCHERLSIRAGKRLQGMLRDAAKQDYGLGPVAYEMKIAANLMRKGFDVEFQDLEGRARYDFLAMKDGARIEVECKFMSGDIGRKIHRKQLYQLGDRISIRMLEYVGKLRTGLLLRLSIPDRLHGKEEHQAALAELLGRAVFCGRTQVESDGNWVSVQEFDVENLTGDWRTEKGFDRERFRATLLSHFGVLNKCSLAYYRPMQSAIVVVVESRSNDNVLDGMQRQLLKSAKYQFEDVLPAFLCCHLVDLTEKQLVSLENSEGKRIGIDAMTEDIIERRPQLFAISYSVPGSVQGEMSECGAGPQESYGEKGRVRTTFNVHHSSFGDERLSIFSDGPP